MKRAFFLGANVFQHPVRLSNSLLLKTILLSVVSIAPFFLYKPTEGTSDFKTLDIDAEEQLSGQSNSFFLRKEYSLTKPYQGPWNLAGSALITGDFVRLTPDQQSRQGAVWSRLPVHVRHWEARVNFRVHGSSGQLFGDGFAFWYVEPGTRFPGPAFGGQDRFRGLGVFLDTYSNQHGPQGHFHPYVSAVVNNGSVAFDHEADGVPTEPFGCTARFRNSNHETLIAIRYVDDTLTVSTDVENAGAWKLCFRIRGVRLPTHYVFGLSAMTGELTDTHDILYMKVYEVDSPINPDDYAGNRKLIVPAIDPIGSQDGQGSPGGPAGSGSWLQATAWWLLALAGLSALVAGLYRGLRSRRRRMKRFY